MINAPPIAESERVRIEIGGAVQGVGFRPFIYRLAKKLDLRGWVVNSAQGVHIEAEGSREALDSFVQRIETEKPPRAVIQRLDCMYLDAEGTAHDFEILSSDSAGEKVALILPDLATCPDCLSEIFDPLDRRYRYPFTNCTNCGPRYSIIEDLPYDRPHTSMKSFTMCEECAREYHDPTERRFHAQPIACPRCGPQLALLDTTGALVCERNDALLEAAELVCQGRIVALKGIGGFQLIADARAERVVERLRKRKRREEKPFALLYPAFAMVRVDCEVSDIEEQLLLSPEAPIVLLKRRAQSQRLAANVAPGNPNIGVMLPCSPLHHLLMRELGFPVIATSGNLSDEPICTDEREAVARLAGIADAFLVHDRPVVRHVDDSVVRVILGREQVLRRARGYAPLPVQLRESAPCVLALGAHLKNSVALSVERNAFISQHIGDLETAEAHEAFRKVSADLQRLYDARPAIVACDMHPDYLSTRYAQQLHAPTFPVQHHWAHVLACMADNELEPPLLGVAWDGTGYGTDGTIWGGEFFLANQDYSFERIAHLRHFRLPGGAAAIKQPRRAALGLLHSIWGNAAFQRRDIAPVRDFTPEELSVLVQLLERQTHAPLTSSAGRLFDAVAALLGLRPQVSFEGQAAMELEFAADPTCTDASPFTLKCGQPLVVDWQPIVEALLEDLLQGEPIARISARFHRTLAEIVVAVAIQADEKHVVLSGGCFQNRFLTEACVQRLCAAGFRPYWHQRVPPNDGGISLGQILAAVHVRHPVSPVETTVVS